MSSYGKSSANVNKTIILDTTSGTDEAFSACTGVYTNQISSCSGDTITFNSNISGVTIDAQTFLSGGTNILDIVNASDTFVSGGTYSGNTITLNRNDGNEVLITGITTDNFYVTGGTLSDKTLVLDRNDTLSAVTINLSGLTTNAGNGLTLDGDTIKLGGTLDSTTTINGGGNNLYIGGIATDYLDNFFLTASGNTTVSSLSSDYLERAYVQTVGGGVTAPAVRVEANNFSNGENGKIYINESLVRIEQGSSAGGYTKLEITSGSTIFTDNTPSQAGIEYAADYSAGYTDNSLITNRDLNNAISTVTGDTYVSGFTYDNNNNFTISLNDGTDLTANISQVSGLTVNGNVLVNGNVDIIGSVTTINSEQVLIKDNIITLNSNVTGTTMPVLNSGFEVLRGSGTTKQFLWNESTDEWTLDDNTRISGDTYITGSIYSGTTDLLDIFLTTLTDGNGTTANGNAVDLGGTLNAGSTILEGAGSLGSSLSIGNTEGLSSVLINAQVLNGNFLTTYGGGGVGTSIGSNPGGVTINNNLNSGVGITTSFALAGSSLTSQVVDTTNTVTTFFRLNGTTINSTTTNTATGNYGVSDVQDSRVAIGLYNGSGIITVLDFDNLVTGKTLFTDNRVTTTGIEYAADYSTGYTPLSLITYQDLTGTTLSDGNGITIGTGNTIDLGGLLSEPFTVLSGGTTAILDLGGNTAGANLAQGRINATSFQVNNLTAYDGSGVGTAVNSNPGSFSITNNLLNNVGTATFGGIITLNSVDSVANRTSQLAIEEDFVQLNTTNTSTGEVVVWEQTYNSFDLYAVNSGATELFRLKFDRANSKALFIDSRPTTSGIEYVADYSSGYTPDSLIVKRDLDNRTNRLSESGITGVTVVDTISSGITEGATWHYTINDGSNLRAGTVVAGWLGSNVVYTETSTTDIGDTSAVTLDVNESGGNIRLVATPSSGTWEIKVNRFLI